MTARLSKRFYDVLGEDIANELVDWFNAVDLTYRADLRELNELNFARFDAKLEQRLAELRAELLTELRTGIAGLRTELRTEIAGLRTEIAGQGTDIAGLRMELRTEVAGLRGELRTGLQQVRTELLRWMFGFWVSTLIGIAGLLIALRGP